MNEERWLARFAALTSAAVLLTSLPMSSHAASRQTAAKMRVKKQDVSPQLALLTNGSGDGTATVSVDPYGAFDELTFDPVGEQAAAETTYESGLWFSGAGRAGQGGNGGFLSVDTISGPTQPPIAFQSVDATKATSEFTVDGVRFQLVQEMLPSSDGTSTFRQIYTLKNETGAATSFDLLRHIDGDLQFDGSISDRAGVSSDRQRVFEFDSGDDPNQPTTFVGIQMSGGTDLGFRVAPYPFKGTLLNLGRESLGNTLSPDEDHDGLTDSDFDVTMTQGRTFTLAADASAQLVVETILGYAAPSQTTGVSLNLEASTTNTSAAGGQVSYTATVSAGSAPVAGKSVVFLTSGTTGNNGSATVQSGDDGAAHYSFMPWFPGANTITAYVDLNLNGQLDENEPTASAPLTVTRPANRDGVAFGKGRMYLGEALGTVLLNVQSRRGRVLGHISLSNQAGLDLRNIRPDTLVFGGVAGNQSLIIFGTTRIPGMGQVPFRLDALDRGIQSHSPDRCVITLFPTNNGGAAVSYGGDLISARNFRSDLVFLPSGSVETPSDPEIPSLTKK